jgi:predicted regulator of Ras-like GTPase activity (Roadblock/LC7/MglB family)
MGEARWKVDAHGGDEAHPQALLAANSSASSSGVHPMVIGYNHDVPHRGRIYHVQTEDSGRGRGHIFTHVFHAGTIVATHRVDYGDGAAMADVIDLLRSSHKSMMRRLVDELISRCLGEGTRSSAALADGSAPSRALPEAALVPAPAPAPEPPPDDDPISGHPTTLQALIEALDMDNISQTLDSLRNNVAGTLGVALVDYESGMCLGTSGTGINLDVAAAGNMDVMKAKARVMRDLGIKGGIEDILITLDTQYHIIRPIGTSLFLYLAIDRQQGNLALARHKLATAAAEVKV